MRARENPFATDRVLQIRYRLQGETWPGLLQRLAGLRYRAAIVGPEGTGKTTLLEDLRPHLEELGFRVRYAFLNAADRTWSWQEMRTICDDLKPGDMILLDGADHLGRLGWTWLKWRSMSASGLVITSHREGMLPTLIQTRTSAELLSQIVDRLLGDRTSVAKENLAGLFERHEGNVRDAIRELYDVFARMDG
ncbi:MAG: hypothetical protein ACM359_14880 [Bacillota bacterium]